MSDDKDKIERFAVQHKIRLELDEQLEKEMAESEMPVPSNEEIISLIPSKATRNYLIKTGHVFSERDREILRRYLKPIDDDEFNSVYEPGRYVSIPHPFRRGDIVACIHNGYKWAEDYDLGIMRSFDDDEAWKSWDSDVQTRLKDMTDFSDVGTTVEFLMDDGTFSHNHPNPMELEFAKDIPGALVEDSLRTTYLEVASELIKGEGSIELFEMYKEAYTASPEHLIELLQDMKICIAKYKEYFDSFKQLSKSQKDDVQSVLFDMEHKVWRVKRDVETIKQPFYALGKKTWRGTFYKEISEEQKQKVRELLAELFSETNQILLQIDDYTKQPDCPRKMFYQKSLKKEIEKLKTYSRLLK